MTGKVIATFNLVHEKVVKEIQRVEKYPEDIAESLRKLEEFDTIKLKPTVKIITKTEASLKDGSYDQNVKAAQGEYQEDTKQWKARERQYSANKIKCILYNLEQVLHHDYADEAKARGRLREIQK